MEARRRRAEALRKRRNKDILDRVSVVREQVAIIAHVYVQYSPCICICMCVVCACVCVYTHTHTHTGSEGDGTEPVAARSSNRT